jgi:hypothetical protein
MLNGRVVVVNSDTFLFYHAGIIPFGTTCVPEIAFQISD